MAAAFAHTFWWSVGAILIAFIPTLFLPNHAARAVPAHADEGEAGNGPAGDGRAGSEDPGTRVAGAMLD